MEARSTSNGTGFAQSAVACNLSRFQCTYLRWVSHLSVINDSFRPPSSLILRLASRPHNPRCFRMDPHCPFSAAHSSAPILLCGLSSTTGVHTSWKHFTNLLLSFPMVAATPSNKVLESTTICVAGLAQVVTPQSSAKPSSSRLFLYPLCVSSEVANVSKVLAELLTSASYQLRRMY